MSRITESESDEKISEIPFTTDHIQVDDYFALRMVIGQFGNKFVESKSEAKTYELQKCLAEFATRFWMGRQILANDWEEKIQEIFKDEVGRNGESFPEFMKRLKELLGAP